ncbi:MAG: cell wall-binding repeat-containing protein [Euzebyales bacterium]|nr:cell wall-binding repeat-containing protein [Euzebyales bacterium]
MSGRRTTRRKRAVRWIGVPLALALAVGMAPVAGAAPVQSLELVSATPGGQAGGGESKLSSFHDGAEVSADGRVVVFESFAADLTGATDVNGVRDVFVRDLVSGTTTLVSANPSGDAGDGASFAPTISADGRTVAFSSEATDLTGDPDANGATDVFARDLETGVTELVSATILGEPGGNHSFSPVISGDGGTVVFASMADDLTPNIDANGAIDLFARDLDAGTTRLVSVRPPGVSANGPSSFAAVSADGRTVAFSSSATDLTGDPDANGASDVFVRDLDAGVTELVSVTPGAESGNGISRVQGLSDDGRVVAFNSEATDLTGDADANGDRDVFVRDLDAGVTTLVSVTPGGDAGNGFSAVAALSGDGGTVAFLSAATDLTGDPDGNGLGDIFARDLDEGATTLVSVTPGGETGDDASFRPRVSADGRTVVFTSRASDLTGDPDTNLAGDVFARDLDAGVTTLVSATPGGQAGNGDSFRAALSADGRTVAFDGFATDLTGDPDTNGGQDVFAAVLNSAPVAVDDAATTVRDSPVTIDVLANDSDADGDPLTVAAVTDPPEGVAVVNGDGTVTYTPGAGFTGTDTFDYQVEDGRGGAADATVTVTVTPPDPPQPPVDPGPVDVVRLSGPGRIETAIAISNDSYGDGEATTVVLARADDYPDALTGAALAIAADGPLLITSSNELLGAVADELQRVLPAGGTVHVLGGDQAIEPAAYGAVADLGYDVERIFGPTRFETAVAIAEFLGSPDPTLLTTGLDFPDALVAGAASGQVGGAVLLTAGEDRHAAVDAYLDAKDEAQLWAVGGPAALAYPEAEGVFGPTREGTAVAAAEEFFAEQPSVVGFARRDDFPDALTGGAHIGRLGGPLLLTFTDQLSVEPESYLCQRVGGFEIGYVYGGTAAINDQVADLLEARINGEGCVPQP